jgi:hypothetical protein
VGLIAREIEAAGIPTLSMTSAFSITRAVNPPRAAFLDFPLGHTTGKAHDPAGQRQILRDALRVFERLETPGQIEELRYTWAEDDAWKDRVMRPDTEGGVSHDDDRVERLDTPQYQCELDRRVAQAAGECTSCVFLEEGAP